MEKLVKSFVFIFLITNFFDATIYAKKRDSSADRKNVGIDMAYLVSSLESVFIYNDALKNGTLITIDPNSVAAPPTVTTPVYYCQNSAAVPLTATPSLGATLNWYGTNAVGGTASSTAPTPSTAVVGTTSYYVSETAAGVQSTRSKIDVIVVADNGATILGFTCDPSQILAADKASSVFFDWGNNSLISNSYNYTYTIQGGSPVTGTTNVSHVQVFGMLPGQSATLTLTSATHPCVPSKTLTCSVPCGASTVTPAFGPIPTFYCINQMPPILPATSTNSPAITGVWNPAAINTTTVGTTNYIFTPDPVLFPCALTKTLSVTVGPVSPDFSDFSICSGAPAPNLNSTSPNGITGVWSPSTIDNTTSGAYVFTPNPGQSCTATVKTINVTVIPSNTIVNLDWTVTAAFSKNQIVTVADPVGVNYLYQLDDGPFQESPIFEKVSLGTHAITVRDVNGCSELTNDTVLVIDYPRFFTPNNDSYNDTWNIFSLRDQASSKILIFDRYGKLLKEIRPSGLGWDGTYIGQPMPANDYWFTVEYIEQDVLRKFKSHFSLKR
ncbi:T9SS type B sorting domain-containing protein [Flavobacterium sp. ZS1P14]|uniref:T9SS type B sorting domain-containing protein n=1 Tax=Flavobacterium sp. ZS1P14 TaxID=3401729 RepID=UPI003AAA527F